MLTVAYNLWPKQTGLLTHLLKFFVEHQTCVFIESVLIKIIRSTLQSYKTLTVLESKTGLTRAMYRIKASLIDPRKQQYFRRVASTI